MDIVQRKDKTDKAHKSWIPKGECEPCRSCEKKPRRAEADLSGTMPKVGKIAIMDQMDTESLAISVALLVVLYIFLKIDSRSRGGRD